MRRHDCVIMPGIGAFIASHKPAFINSEWGVLTPPRREIYFNSSITNNDGLLANSIARKENISFEEASRRLQQEIEQIKKSLATAGETTIGTIGTLKQGEDSTIIFLPFDNTSVNMAKNGFNPICIKPLDKLNSSDFYHQNESGSTSYRNEKNYYIPINKRFAHFAAMIIIIFFAAISLSLPNADTFTDYASILPVKATSEKQNIQTAPTENIIETNIKSQDTEKTIVDDISITSGETDEEYYLIVASLHNENASRKFISETSSNFDLNIVSTPHISRVYVAKSNSMKELQELKNSEDFKRQFSQAWIWHNK